jgi:hypothetical protein
VRTELSTRDTLRHALYVILAGWLWATAAAQSPNPRYRARPERWLLVPNWRFFAPNPFSKDVHLLYRDELADGTLTGWSELPLVTPRAVRQAVWYPDGRYEKTFVDAVSDLKIVMRKAPQHVRHTRPYHTLLAFITPAVFHPPDAARTQFLIAHSTGVDDSEDASLYFLSEFHPLTPQATP